MLSVLDEGLVDFCVWYKKHFKKYEDGVGVVVACMCGHFHTYTKRAKVLLKRCESLKLLEVRNNIVFLK